MVSYQEVVERETGQVGVAYEDPELKEIPGLPDSLRETARALQNWVDETRATGMIARPTFGDAKTPLKQMELAREIAADDDVVANFLEIAEGIALAGVKWESAHWETQDVFNQMAAEHNLDSLMRKMWREDFIVSQAVVAAYWEYGEFTIRGETEKGNKRKAKRRIYYPSRFAVLDSTKVMPVQMDAFGGERLAWKPSDYEKKKHEELLAGTYSDEAMKRFFVGEYTPTPDESKELGSHATDLILLDGNAVTRHTATRSDYERWAPVRMKSIFRLLDLKLQLIAADRVALVGAANYILVVKKGDEKDPAKQTEIDNLKEGFKTLARIPVIFSDHRLSIEIVTPAQDFTLEPKKYDLLDIRIIQRLINGIPAGGTNGSFRLELGKSTAMAFQGRRHMLKRYLERTIAKAVIEHEKNAELDWPEGPPSLSFTPGKIQLGEDAQLAQQILALRTQKEISRESTLEYFGFDQAVEAMRRVLEETKYDDIFKTTVPFSSPNGQVPADQGGAGAQGGRPDGGGKTSENPTKTNVTDKGTTVPDKGKA